MRYYVCWIVLWALPFWGNAVGLGSGKMEVQGAVLSEMMASVKSQPDVCNSHLSDESALGAGVGWDQKLIVRTTVITYPSFWSANWFLVAMILIGLCAVLVVVSVFLLKRNRKIRTENGLRKLLTEYRLKALQAQVNPQFVSNTLASIQYLMLSNNMGEASLYVARFGLLLRSLLEYSTKSVAVLKNELEMIELYVELEKLRFSNHFSFQLIVDDAVDPATIRIPALITRPFLENAIWHGLLPLKERNPELSMYVYREAELLIISIRDNGVGRNSERMPQDETSAKSIRLMGDRIANLNRIYGTNATQIRITDHHDEVGESVGTTVDIVLPMRILEELYEQDN